MSARVELRNAAANESDITSEYIRGNVSYRVKLNDETIKDMTLVVTAPNTPTSSKRMSSDGDFVSDIKNADSEEMKKKETFKFIMPHWCTGGPLVNARDKTVNGVVGERNREHVLKPFFPEDIDGELKSSMKDLRKASRA